MSNISLFNHYYSRVLLFVCISVLYSTTSYSQVFGIGCQEEDVAVLGLERKDWNNPSGNTSIHSEGSMHNFTLPNSPGPCKRISNISISINVISPVDLTNLPADCVPTPNPYYYNIHTGCAPFLPASCPGAQLISETNFPTFDDRVISINGNFAFGDNLAIDIVPVMNTFCTNGQSALSAVPPSVVLDYEVCVIVTVIDELITTPVNIGGTSPICPLATTMIGVGPYSEYLWSPGGQITQAIDVGPGTYNVTVTDGNGCTDTDEIIISAFPVSPITFNPASPSVCGAGTVSVGVVEGYAMYEWSNTLSGQTVNLSPGMYDVTITDGNLCTAVNSVTVATEPNPDAGGDNSMTICNNAPFNLTGLLGATADAGGIFSNPSGTGNLSGSMVNTAGLEGMTIDYLYTVGLPTDPCGQAVATLTLTIEEPLEAGDNNSATLCDNAPDFDLTTLLSADADAGGAFSDPGGTGSLTGSMVDVSGLGGQTVNFTYTVGLPTDACGTDQATLTLTVSEELFAGVDNSTTVCDGDFVDLNTLLDGSADGGGAFSDPAGTGSLAGATVNTQNLGGQTLTFIYEVGIATDPCGTDQATLTVVVESFVDAGVDNSTSVCAGTSVNLNTLLDVSASTGGTFSDPSSTGTLTGFTVNTTGEAGQTLNFVYTVGTAGSTCGTDEATLTVMVTSSTEAGDDNTTTVCEGSTVDLSTLLALNADAGGTYSDPGATGALTIDMVNTTGRAGQTLNFIYTVGSAADPCGQDQTTLTVTVESSLEAGDDNSVTLCIGGIINLDTYLANADLGGTYTDTDGSGGLSGNMLNTASITPGPYTYQYEVGDGVTCPLDNAVIELIFSGSLDANFAIDTIEICYDICQEVNLTFTGAGPFTYDLAVSDQNGVSQANTSLSSSANAFSIYLCNDESMIEFSNDTLNFNNLDSLVLTLENVQGDACNSALIDSLWITSLPANVFQLDTSICILDTLFINGLELFSGNSSYIDTIPGIECDSFININVTFSNIDTSYIVETICAGDSVNYFSTWFDEDFASDEFPVSNPNGCDSLFIVDISFFPLTDSLINPILCEGDFIIVDGVTYNEANPMGQEILENQGANGCDSLVNIDLQFGGNIIITRTDTLCGSGSITIGGMSIDMTNNPIMFDVPGVDCDTTFDINLTFADPLPNNIAGIYCNNFDTLVNGVVYDINNPSDAIIITEGSYLGCDSIINIDLFFLASIQTFVGGTYCTDFDTLINGVLYDLTNPSDVITIEGGSFEGCDSIITIDLTFVDPIPNNIIGTFCSDFDTLVNGVVYDISNPSAMDTIFGGSFIGCDSLIVVDLQFDNGIIINRTDSLCVGGSVVIGGTVFNEANNPNQIIVPGIDCDTTFDINLTFVTPIPNNISGTFCSDFDTLVNGVLYDINNPSDTETIIGGSFLGCDSLIVIDLQFDNGIIINRTDSLCAGGSVVIGGTVFNEANNPNQIIVPGIDCDTTFDINLTFFTSIPNNISGNFCSDFDTLVNGVLYDINNPSDTETIVGGNFLGCDSLIVIDLSFMTCDVDVTVSSVGNNCVGDNLGMINVGIASAIALPYTIVIEEQVSGVQSMINVTMEQNNYQFDNLPTGTYTVSVVGNDGTVLYIETTTVDDLFAPLSGTWNLIDTIFCNGELAQLEFIPSGGLADYNYLWNSTDLGIDSIINQVPSGTYSISVSDMNGCTYNSSFDIQEGVAIMVNITETDATCVGVDDGSIDVLNIQGGVGPYTVLFDGQEITEFPIDSIASGVYTLEVVDSENCSTGEEQITILPGVVSVLADYTLEYDIDEGDTVILVGQLFEDSLSFQWDSIPTLSCFDCAEPLAFPSTTSGYNLVITTEFGCIQMVSIIINVSESPEEPEVEVNNSTPNIFSPNGDGNNDSFILSFEDESISQLELFVFDRWGNQMHNGTNSDGIITWNGTRNGNEISIGVYVYQLIISYADGTSEVMVRDLTLVK